MPVWSLYYVPVVPTPGFPRVSMPGSNGSYVGLSTVPMHDSLWFFCLVPYGSYACYSVVSMSDSHWFLLVLTDSYVNVCSLQFLNLTSSDYCACFPAFPLHGSLRALCLFPVVLVPGSLGFLYLVPSGS